MDAAEQPADAERDDHSRIRLRLDGISQRPLKGAGSLSRGCGRGIGDRPGECRGYSSGAPANRTALVSDEASRNRARGTNSQALHRRRTVTCYPGAIERDRH